jgi:hypothetical protein
MCVNDLLTFKTEGLYLRGASHYFSPAPLDAAYSKRTDSGNKGKSPARFFPDAA